MEYWSKKLTNLVVSLYENGKTCAEISTIIKNKKTAKSINNKLHRLGCKRKKIEWNDKLINKIIGLINKGKNYKEIGVIVNKSQNSINRKFNRLGYKVVDNYKNIKRINEIKINKYKKINWKKIQKEYDKGAGYRDIIKIFKLHSGIINWAKENNLLKFRTQKEGNKKAHEVGKYPKLDKNYKNSLIRYRELCKFKFNVYNYPNEFDFNMVEQHGWYKAKNRGNNLKGVSKDHKYSIKEGFLNKIDPDILSHPSNCRLILHGENISKNSKCCISLKDLKKEIIKWNKKHGKFKNIGN